MTTLTATEIPGYVAGTWHIDPVHSDVVVHRPPHDGEQGAGPFREVQRPDRDGR